jgi:hypothetical protein
MVQEKYFLGAAPKIFARRVDEDLARRFNTRRATITSSISAAGERLRR